MAVTIAVESPLQDDVRALIAALNATLLELTPAEFCTHLTVEQMAGRRHDGLHRAGRRAGRRVRRAEAARRRDRRGEAHVHRAGRSGAGNRRPDPRADRVECA